MAYAPDEIFLTKNDIENREIKKPKHDNNKVWFDILIIYTFGLISGYLISVFL